MVSLDALLQLIFEELKTVIDAETGVTTPGNHVGLFDREKDIQTPFFGFEWTLNTINRGLGGNRRIAGENSVGTHDVDGTHTVTSTDDTTDEDIIEFIVARDYLLTIDLGAVADGDSPRQRTKYMEALRYYFSQFTDSPNELDPDVNRVREMATTPSPTGNDLNASARVTFEIEYTTYDIVEESSVESVDLDIDVSNTDTYPENY